MKYRLGKSYEELSIGEEASFTKTITETDVVLFAGISGDFNPLHMDEMFARRSVFGARIAHGALAQALIAPVLGMQLPGLGTIAVEVSCRFRAPTFFGDTITATARVAEKLEDRRQVRMALHWVNQRGERVAVGEAVVIPPSPRALETPVNLEPKTQGGETTMALESVQEVFTKMPEVFNVNEAQGLDAVFQFDITGEGAGQWHVVIKEGACQVSVGTHDSPSVTLTMSGETWLGIVNKQLNGMQAFMSGQLKASGDIMLAQRIEQLFPL